MLKVSMLFLGIAIIGGATTLLSYAVGTVLLLASAYKLITS